MREKFKTPTFYPCGLGVKIPQVGSDETVLKMPLTEPTKRSFSRLAKKLTHTANKNYIQDVSSGLSFEQDVVRDRCFHLMPYDKKYLHDVLDFSSLIARPLKTRTLPGRHNQRGVDKRHMPCHLKNRASHHLKPIKRRILQKAKEMNKEETRNKSPSVDSEAEWRSAFLTQESFDPEEQKEELQPQQQPQLEWDRYLLSNLSMSTAQWLVKQRMESGTNREDLQRFLEKSYGPLDDGDVDLIQDSLSEVEMSVILDSDNPWRKREDTLLDRVRELTLRDDLPTDPYADITAAPFYRLPAGFRRAKKFVEKEHEGSEFEGAINSTAHDIEVAPYVAPLFNPFEDIVNPKARNIVHQTENQYEREWLAGVKQVHQKSDGKGYITMDSQNKYKKHLVKESPGKVDTWYTISAPKAPRHQKMKKFERGLHRWQNLPEAIDTERSATKPYSDDQKVVRLLQNVGADLQVCPSVTDKRSMAQSPDHSDKKQIQSNHLLTQIIDDWRGKWHLDMRYGDATPEDLIKDMADLHTHIRLKAITTCARAAEYKPPPELGIQLNGTKESSVRLLPDELFAALECCLEDEHEQVQRAAAIALYSLEHPTLKAESILRKTLQQEQSSDRWTAAQCLAYYGECDSEVVGELVYQLLHSEDAIRHEQSTNLLTKLSENSTLVHSMLAEQLNSSSWRHRVMACTIIPKLNGHINRDLTQKLAYLMWNDWHNEVRKVAAQTLGRTGHGKDVHDELLEKITKAKEKMRTEAVSKIGYLGIMTAKLLPAFLACFEDNYVSVRMECCRACSNLKMDDAEVLRRLIHLATYDPIWKVKALAIQAFGRIGVLNADIRGCVLWAFRYEDQAGVRAEACHTIIRLQIKGKDIGQALQDRYLVETNEMVKREIIDGLAMLDILPTEDMDMVTQVKEEVRKLFTRGHVCAQITTIENEEARLANLQRMIYQPPGSRPQQPQTSVNVKDERRILSQSPVKVILDLPADVEISKRPMTVIPKEKRVDKSASSSTESSSAELLKLKHSERPDDQDRSIALTPMADMEVQAIMNRPDSSSISGTLSSLSRHNEPLGQVDPASRTESESADATAPHDASKEGSDKASTPLLEESRSYVEITVGGPLEHQDVVDARHVSPDAHEVEERKKANEDQEQQEQQDDSVLHEKDGHADITTTQASAGSPKRRGRSTRRHAKLERRGLRENSLDDLGLETAVSRYSINDDNSTSSND